ncbi:MAG: SpoIIE family protein phosphatase [Gemmataceae bacterium]|nr:SpoIIE family protein phosphatase [Gemmataceae bacterium]
MNSADWHEDPTPFPYFARPPGAEPRPEGSGQRGPTRREVRVLLIEDNRGDARLIQEYLAEVEGMKFRLECVERFGAGLERLTRGGIDVVLLDLSLPDARGLETFVRLQRESPGVPVVVLTGFNDEVLAVKAVQEGAEDYLVKGYVNSNLLARSLRYAIERTRRRQAERTLRETHDQLHAARQIQQRLFPQAAPALPGMTLAGASFPAEATGGDYFDYIPMLDRRIGVVVSDVAGHGFGPALVMASTRAYLRGFAQTHDNVADILTLTNRVLTPDIGEDRFVTLFLARIDPVGRSLVFGNAGHPSGYVLNADGRVKHALDSMAIPLGVEPDFTFPCSEPIPLAVGDVVVLVTDGVIEARAPDDTPFGTGRVFDIVRVYRADPPAQIVYNLYHAVRAFAQNQPQLDDITTVVIKVGEMP